MLYQLGEEEKVIRQLERQYRKALEDVEMVIRILMTDEQTPSKINRINYQKRLQTQLEGVLEALHNNEYKTINAFLQDSYTDSFVGAVYDMHGQGVPLILPIDQNAAVKAIQLDTKLSERKIHPNMNGEHVTLYESLGVDIDHLKKAIRQEITRGIATGMEIKDIARNISLRTKAPLSRAKTIARTESHRIQESSKQDARTAAREKGADVVKKWDSTMDGDTRPDHRALDGQIREVDEPFEIHGKRAMNPGGFGKPGDDCNCRCLGLTIARWLLGEEDLERMQEKAKYWDLDKTQDFADFKKKYLKAAEEEASASDFIPAKSIKEAEEYAASHGVKYAVYSNLPLETANALNQALTTLPDDVRPVFMGASSTLEQYWGGKLPRGSKQYYGVTIETHDGIHLGYGNGVDFETEGYMVGISSSYKTADKITKAKEAEQARYYDRHGRKWFYNVSGETTAAHEMGHVYTHVKGLPKGFEEAAAKWAKEAECDMLKKPSEAWAEAWAAYHTGSNTLPDYIQVYIAAASGIKKPAKTAKPLKKQGESGVEKEPAVTFAPAKTRVEAEAYAKRFAASVKYEGIALDKANTINEELTRLTSKYPMRQLEEIAVGGKGVMSASHSRLTISKTKSGAALDNTQANFMQEQEQERQNLATMMERFAGRRMPPAIAKSVEKLENSLRYQRHAVYDTYPDKLKWCVVHEYGHIISDQYFGMFNKEIANQHYTTNPALRAANDRWQQIWYKAHSDGSIYSVSKYGATNEKEFFAECFTAREAGEVLPDYIEEFMAEVLKNGIL